MVRGADHGRALATAEVSVRRLRSLLSELGDVPALPHDLEITGNRRGDRLAALRAGAPESHRPPTAAGVAPRLGGQLEQLADLCQAMADDVVAMLAGGFEA